MGTWRRSGVRSGWHILAVGAAAIGAGCAPRVHLPAAAAAADRAITLHGHVLTLHVANAGAAANLPLLVYATGDGGWHRKDLDAYRRLVSWGYPIVGFDARDYVTHLDTPRETTTPARLAADYAEIIRAARASMPGAAGRPVVLVGISRGADLAVVAAAQPRLKPSIAGVLAVALTREEEYVRWFRRFRRGARQSEPGTMAEPYNYLPRLGTTPVAIVQSTRDGYLPATQARALLGPDTPWRWLQSIEARNHSFGGARDQLYRSMHSAIGWIVRSLDARTGAGTRKSGL